MDIKRPQIFIEMAVAGYGSDWILTELGRIGDISINYRAARPQSAFVIVPGLGCRQFAGPPPSVKS
jgi:hypothetical protein